MRKIIHIDMDCFFAAVEIRDNPELKKSPVAVGRHPSHRGVVAAANYHARKFGVHSALSMAEAIKRCPGLVIVNPRFETYKMVSKEVFGILRSYSPIVEAVSIDEAFLDVTQAHLPFGSASFMAQEIRKKVFQITSLTCSAGIAPNPFLAKVASDWNKPNGQFTISPEKVAEFMKVLPLKKVPGIGQVSQEKLAKQHLYNCEDLQKIEFSRLNSLFGSRSYRVFNLVRGYDDRVIGTPKERKSLSVEQTFIDNLLGLSQCLEAMPEIYQNFQKRLKQKSGTSEIKNLFLKIKFSNFNSTTVESCQFTKIKKESFEQLLEIGLKRSPLPVRLLGLGVRFKKKSLQLEMF